MDRAAKEELPSHMNHSYLNSQQTDRLVRKLVRQVKHLRLEDQNNKRKLRRRDGKLAHFDQIVVCIAQKNLRQASRILHRSLKRGDSLARTLDRLVSAANGKGKERAEWTEYDLDVANLIRLEGGPRLLYAMAKSDGYASRTTLARRRPIPEIKPSMGIPSAADVSANINSLLGARGRKAPPDPAVGQVLMVDDVSLNEYSRYNEADNNVVGLCREHVERAVTDTTINSMADIVRLETALVEKTVHHGKEATVVAIAPVTGTDHYSPSPIVVSPTCKTEDGKGSAIWIKRTLDTYHTHPCGEAVHGPITAIATDGASQFRTMRFMLCHSEVVGEDTPVGRIICQLKGMNRRTGANGLLGTCDVKHIIKRFATRLRSQNGVQVNKSEIYPEHIFEVLQQLKGMAPEKAKLLLNPIDKQNVPAAVNLLQTLLDLNTSTLPGARATATPSLLRKLEDIIFVSRVLGQFLLPFITPNMSLSEQIRHLSTYSHLITALYRKHRTGFLSSQLYADSQAIVKNIIFTAARLQSYQRNIPYYILFEGTDRLEGVFSHARTQDHARNFDILQLAHKLSIGAEINAIYERHPHLHRGHKRLNLVNARGIDHMNPRSWQGDVNVDRVDIVAEYNAGREAALAILAEKYGREHGFDYDEIFSKPDHDHLRPFGKYVGIKHVDEESDDAEDDAEEIDEGVAEVDNGSLAREGVAGDGGDEGDHGASTENSISDPTEFDEGHDDDLEDDLGPEISETDFDTILAPNLNTPALDLEGARPRADPWIEVDGERLNKHVLVAKRLTATSTAAHKITHRFFRVRGDTTESLLFGRQKGKGKGSESASSDDDVDRIWTGDPGVVLVRSGRHISLAVAEVLNFRQGSSTTNLGSVPFDDVYDEKKKITVAVQFMELKPTVDTSTGALEWVWTGDYLNIAKPSDPGTLTHKEVALRTPARHFLPVAPTRTEDGSWSFSHSELETLLREAWSDLDPEGDAILSQINALPMVDPTSARLPMVHPNPPNTSNPKSLHVGDAPVDLVAEKLPGDAKVQCKLCPHIDEVKQMRNHVAKHILYARRNVTDLSMYTRMAVGALACGWCGQDNCKTEMTLRPRRAALISSNCPYHYAGMQYKSANTSTIRSPSTNVPVQCTLCPKLPTGQHPTVWKYNFWNHMAAYHADEETGVLVDVPRELSDVVRIRLYEELAMDVAEHQTRDFRQSWGIQNTDLPEPDEYIPPPANFGMQLVVPPAGAEERRKRSFSTLSILSNMSRDVKSARLDS
ncbi:hypothetical protein D9611_002091 [Ephemerocybe angulata]|uniref:Uncharacterized protein n=1 Tax=Ephemerocybe angulata TaxID=980116 RepID=A0A8H5CI58_9AGAR|nr:hypothetical protein D9611_002091 [Tulosesus angulatus]